MIVRKQAPAAIRAAFTLMEVLVVVAILVVLAAIAVPIYTTYLENSKLDRAKLDVKNLETAVQAYYMRNDVYPDSLQMLTQVDALGNRPTLTADTLIDPWRQPYQLDLSTVQQLGKPRVFSNGPPGGQHPIDNLPRQR